MRLSLRELIVERLISNFQLRWLEQLNIVEHLYSLDDDGRSLRRVATAAAALI